MHAFLVNGQLPEIKKKTRLSNLIKEKLGSDHLGSKFVFKDLPKEINLLRDKMQLRELRRGHHHPKDHLLHQFV